MESMSINDLKQMRIWILWQRQTRKGKTTKVPFAADGGKTGTNEQYRHTWVTYDEAVAAQKRFPDAGIGFVLPDEFVFLDIDHAELDDPIVRLMLSRFHSYAEKSPSDHGIHIVGRVDATKLPVHHDAEKKRNVLDSEFYQKNSKLGIEQYLGGTTNRFATFTGNAINDLDLTDCTDAVLTTLDKEMRKKPKVKYSAARDGDRDIFDIVCNLRKQKNSEKFIKLYDNGDFSDYGSQSEADAALCALIAFRTGPDPEAIDEVFRGSALYREKWNRADYRTSTIDAGITACNGVFHKSHMEHPPFIKFDEKTGASFISVPLLAKYVREKLDYILVRDSGKQALLKYVYENGCYRLYADNMFLGIIKQFIADYDEELVQMSKVFSALQDITTDLCYVTQDALNADEDIINFQNGLLKVSATGTELLPHSPEVYSTIQLPCDWKDEDIPTPVFDAYLDTLTDGDEEVKQLLMEFIGVAISNVKGWRMKKALFLVGKGNTGKSQLKSLVERLLGRGNFIGIDLKEIEARFGTGAVYGTRLAGSSDMSFLSVSELKTFKSMTGGDSIFAEFKGMPPFEFTYNGVLWFCMNQLPKFGGDNGKWVYDRIMVVKCPNVIGKDKQDKHLLDKMYAERDGIVRKAVKALQIVIANGYSFSEPESITRARDEYQASNSTVISFYEECMCPWDDGKIVKYCTTGRIYKVYQAWCKENNNGYSKTAKEFREELAEHLGSTYAEITTRQKGNTYYKNLTITDETKQLYEHIYGTEPLMFLAG